MPIELTLIYNAASGRRQAVLDSLHKALHPQSYPCDLCRLTHHFWGERKTWANFRKKLDGSISVYHKDEIPEELMHLAANLPVILVNTTAGWRILLKKTEIRQCANAEDLTGQILIRLQEF
ncbi:MAG: hypothetical protein Kow0037_25340 [Calditrichia bacterium]